LTDPVGTAGGLDDLVLANSLDGSITIAFQTTPGVFDQKRVTLPAGIAPSDIALRDVNGDGLLDIAVTDQASGDVSVFLNDASHTFATGYRFRAGTGVSGLQVTAASPAGSTLEQSVSLAAGDFTGSGRTDLVVVNRGAHAFTVLAGEGHGGFLGPRPA